MTGQKAMDMKMQAVPGGLKVAKGESVTLKPGSYHVILTLQAAESLGIRPLLT